MRKQITVFGTSHRLQGAPNAHHVHHVVDPCYGRYLERKLRSKHFDFVLEEVGEFGPTIAEEITTRVLGKDRYLDIDPHPTNRIKFGFPDLRDEREPIDPDNENEATIFYEDLEGQAKREELWVQRCQQQTFTSALLICGILHALNLSFRLQAAGLSVATGVYIPYHKLGS